MKDIFHIPVLVDQVVRSLTASDARLIIDSTLGDGGHAEAILKSMPSDGRLIGIDQDAEALHRTQKRLSVFGERFYAIHGNFRDLHKLLALLDLPPIDGILADLGVSTLQISDPRRGFMFSEQGPLSMQMNPDSSLTAEEIVNTFSEKELAEIIRNYGEERAFRRIAAAIVNKRNQHRISTTEELADIVRRAVPNPFMIKTLARVFQSIRMRVNLELESLQEFLPQAVTLLTQNGRLVVLSYHSGEDTIVKRFMRQQANPCICPPYLPRCVCDAKPQLKSAGKLIMADEEETQKNSHARSVRLRCSIKL